MTAEELIGYLAPLGEHRKSLYLSMEKIEDWYLQKVSQIMDLRTGEVLSGKIEAGLFGILKSEVGGDKSTESEVIMDKAVVQGVVAENVARVSKTLVDLSSAEPKKGELVYYLGAARVTVAGETISSERTGLSPGECSTIGSVRKSQEDILRIFDPHAGTIVLTFAANGRAFASIGSLKSVVPNWLASYHGEDRFGILCTLESTHGDVIFLDPLWVWYE